MQVQTVIKALQELDPKQQIMIQWFEKEHVELNTNTTYTDEHWDMAVSLFDKWDTADMEELGIQSCIDEAANRLED
jgi:hypothetical protein